jgi:DNA-binding transcriptional regulator YbjK
VPETPGVRAEASRRTRDAIVAATVRIVAREGVAAVTHRRVAAEAGVALSSTTWHFAAKADILEAALRWTAAQEVERIGEIAERLGSTDFDPSAWADELAAWLVDQLTTERDVAVALYRLQVELLGSDEALEVHREWGRGLRAVGQRVLERAPTATPELDVRLVVGTLDGLRMSALNSGEQDLGWVRPAVRRQLQALLG